MWNEVVDISSEKDRLVTIVSIPDPCPFFFFSHTLKGRLKDCLSKHTCTPFFYSKAFGPIWSSCPTPH